MGEKARGTMTNQQIQDAITAISGAPLDAGEQTEALTLLGTITGTLAQKLQRSDEINAVLLLGEAGVVQYDTPSEVKTRLGV